MTKQAIAHPRSREIAGPVGALWLPRDIEYMTAGIAFTKGDVGMVDMAAASQTADFFYEKVIAPTTAGITRSAAATPLAGLFCVALENIGSGKRGRFLFYGHVEALIVGTPAVRTWMSPTNAAAGLTASVAGQIIVATMKQTGVDATTKYVLFDGVNFFGTMAA